MKGDEMDSKGRITLKEAEAIRKARGMTEEEFSVRLGYSSRAYYQAKQRGKLSWWMAGEIAQRYYHLLEKES
jgi:transcriptional regulator with XRE-family HTH domain